MPVDKVELESHAGFVRAYDAHTARRQFQVSLALVLVLGLAAIVLGILTQLDRPMRTGRASALEVSGSPVAEASRS